ncbi:dermonecrotic toxin domain-containing protein [Pseudomonas sp. PD9R]|uniref:dermonecrotic toxin domain-containing protein n=1 Tax=Pseudomonas sp. PD9R TaxID=2853534 RepID=UPI001C448014|nr:DUF6543 domain-containing protein [Pseudomonas sp. PD9R]MBV6822379.1 hypothetical protein [Pseudomonas sp. PD9R]
MVDEFTPRPADFGLTHPLPSSLDQNLILSASTRCNDCRDQWLELMAQSAQSTFDEQWWSARARGTDVSRSTLAARLYRQHFEASSQLAFAQGILTREQLKRLQALIDPAPAGTATVAPAIHVEQLALKSADGTRAELIGALVITQDTDQPVNQWLYLPSRPSAWTTFKNRNDMEQWLIEHHQQLLGGSRLDAASVDYAALENAPLAISAESLLTQLSTPQTDQQRHKTVFALIPDLLAEDSDEEQCRDSAGLFGLLSPDIPLSIRRSALADQHTAMQNLLGKDFQGDQNDPRLLTLKQPLDALAAAEQASVTAASALLNTRNPLHMLELRNLPNTHYDALYQARLAGLRAEADAQLALNQISVEEHQWITKVLDAPEQKDRDADVVVARLSLSVIEADADSTTTHTQELDGVLLFAHPSALLMSSSHSLLLYWPGRFGGLQRFETRQDLEKTLFKLTANEKNLTLHLSALTRNPFEYALQNQLYSCEQQAARLIADHPAPQRTLERKQALEKLREQTLVHLTVPMPAARELAYAQLLEQNHSSALAGTLPTWLGTLTQAQRVRLKGLFTSYITAMKRSHELLERELPPRDAFSKKAIETRLRQDFSLTQDFEVTLNLPESTTWQKVLSGGAAPGTPQHNVLIPSQQRSNVSLAELAQGNIDQAMWWRLSLMRVDITGSDETERQKLKAGITQAWLRTLVSDLDLAGKYETLIRQTFLGTSTATAFSNEYRRECLSEPWRLMLKLQGEFALLQRDINPDGQHVLETAIDANSREAYAANGKRIVLLPAHLTVGGADTQHQGPSTLAGVTFIVEQISGLTLLYLPDSPDGVFLRQYDSLDEARKALFNLCLHTRMVNYLADRALTGDVDHHVSRINQARLKNFDALIGTGMVWPSTTSLAAHLLDVHMGRLLEAHRATSRSNDALYLEHVALKSGAMFNYLKMAFGMVPFVGTAIALYDAWGSANLAVAAFLRGNVGHGLAEVEAVLLSLIDAAMDILPGVAATSGAPAAARAITRQRHLRTVAKSSRALQLGTQRQARRTLERFKGYEYEHQISLAGLQPGTHGIYRGVYRHADGDFMINQGRIYRIELSDGRRGWRLHGTWARPYKQPIALDEAGNWNTHYAVYGTVMEGGGAGGGAVLGHLADGADPLWPEAIRRWLPRWWTDRALRRQLTLTNTADAYTRRLETQTHSTNATLNNYFDLEPNQRPPLRARADLACANDIELAQNQYLNLEELMLFSHGRKRAMIEDIQSRCAWIIVDRSVRRVMLMKDLLVQHLDRIDQLIARSDTTPVTDTTAHLRLMAQRKAVRKDFLKDFDQLHETVEQAHRWNRRITNRAQKSMMAQDITNLSDKFSDANYYYLKSAHVLEIITHYEAVTDLSWVYFHVQLKKARTNVGRALLTQHHLPEVHANFTQRNKVLEDCLATYAEFRRHLSAWALGYPQHLDLAQVAVFLDNLEKVEEFARQAIKHRPSPTPNEGRGARQLFETEDNQLLIGVASTDAATRQKRFTIEGVDGRTETWLPRSSGKYHLSEPVGAAQPELPTDVAPLLAEARKRLGTVDAYKSKVEGYARQDMLPVDLEHMMSSEAAELSMRAQAIERLSPTEPVALQLRNRAQALSRAGRTLRIDQSLQSKTPTEGYLDYLLEQRVVGIRKEGGLRELGKRPDGRRDFLQEYEVRDLTGEPAQTLWYAHFHYTSAKPQFSDFVKGHLKRPEQRHLGLQWQQAQASGGGHVESIWRGDIGKPLGIKHFSEL